jgi:hypothetical protein
MCHRWGGGGLSRVEKKKGKKTNLFTFPPPILGLYSASAEYIYGQHNSRFVRVSPIFYFPAAAACHGDADFPPDLSKQSGWGFGCLYFRYQKATAWKARATAICLGIRSIPLTRPLHCLTIAYTRSLIHDYDR